MFQHLRVSFPDRDAFEREFERHIAQGGIFVPTEEPFQLREVVEVELDLEFCGQAPVFEGEIVNQVRPGRGASGPIAGVAVQFLEPTSELRARLEKITGMRARQPEVRERAGPPRHHERRDARIAAEIFSSTGGLRTSHTLDISRSGALLHSDEDAIPIGEEVHLRLTHPRTGEQLELDGEIVRHHRSDDAIEAIAVKFQHDPGEFVEDSSSAAHARSLGGIRGSLATVGAANLLQMFPLSSLEGTIVLRSVRGASGCVRFQQGALVHVRSGPATGLKALARLLRWTDGTFEFTPAIEPGEPVGEPIPVDFALLQATQYLDELVSLDLSSVPPAMIVERGAALPPDLDEIGQAIWKLAQSSPSVEQIVDQIAAFDSQIYEVLIRLLDQDVIWARPKL